MRRVCLCALTFGLSACGNSGSPTPAQSAQAGPPVIDVVRVVQQPLNLSVEMPGELNPYETVAIYPKVTGYVKSIRVDRGSRVHAGELIAELEAPEVIAQHAESESKLQGAQAQLGAERSKADADASTYDKLKAASATPGVVAGNDVVLAQKALEGDQSQVTAAEQNVEAARQALNAVAQMEGYLRVTAPFAGIVTERNVHPGAFVGPASGQGATAPIVTIVDNSRLRLVVPVPEAYVAGATPGTKMDFTVAGYPGETFSGTVARVAHAVDVTTRTMAVELDVNNRDGRLAPGTYCQVKWPVRRSGPSLLVPTGSVANTTGRTFVVRITNGHTEWVDVKTGMTAGPLVEVFGNLKPGEPIAARGTDEIRAGTEVRTKDAKPVS
jgi:membrane fusion protein (multidrug efflux system)